MATLAECILMWHAAHPDFEPIVPLPVVDAPRRRWARDHDACRVCETTEKPHAGHGRCTGCHARWFRAEGGAPPRGSTGKPLRPVLDGTTRCNRCGAAVGSTGQCAPCRAQTRARRRAS